MPQPRCSPFIFLINRALLKQPGTLYRYVHLLQASRCVIRHNLHNMHLNVVKHHLMLKGHRTAQL